MKRRRRACFSWPSLRDLGWLCFACACVATGLLEQRQLLLALSLLPLALVGLGQLVLRRGWRRNARRWIRAGERIGSLVAPELTATLSLEASLKSAWPDASESALRRVSTSTDALATNARINALIWRGRYRDAVRAFLQNRSRLCPPPLRALAHCNVAEALYNLGRWRRARQLVDAVLKNPGWPPDEAQWIICGLKAQRAWIAAHDGDIALGRQLMSELDEKTFPEDYRAELSFTCAVVELSAGEPDTAQRHLTHARTLLARESSRRNVLFLEARVAALRGRRDEAISLCRRASECAYRGQGGDGLLLWGDLLAEHGDLAAARRAWGLVLERDPESESAGKARARLTPPAEPAL
ncbi:MAG: hypothetical protein AB1938_01630 [Myxococcota bacterium]